MASPPAHLRIAPPPPHFPLFVAALLHFAVRLAPTIKTSRPWRSTSEAPALGSSDISASMHVKPWPGPPPAGTPASSPPTHPRSPVPCWKALPSCSSTHSSCIPPAIAHPGTPTRHSRSSTPELPIVGLAPGECKYDLRAASAGRCVYVWVSTAKQGDR